MRNISRLPLLLLFALALGLLASCRMNDSEADQYLRLNLSPSLAGYDRVLIQLVSAQDTGELYEVVWNAKLEKPADFPKYRLTTAKGKAFVIQIRAYNAQGILLLAKDVEVRDARPQPTVVVKADLRLHVLRPARGSLSPAFDPEIEAYSLELPDSIPNIGFTVEAMDPLNNTLTLEGQAAAWGAVAPLALTPGTNSFEFTVQGKQGGPSRTYVVSIKFGVNQAGAPVVRILSPKDGDITNRDTVEVSWTVDGVEQSDQTREILAAPDGIKFISRQKQGPDGKLGQAEVRVTRDTEPPKAPKASATTPTSSLRPVWSWGTVEDGNGTFRFRLDTAALGGAAEAAALSFTPARDLAPGAHTLYLQARDAAGNWSATDSFAVTILGEDETPPEPPKLRGTSPTHVQPKWIWSPGGGNGVGEYEYKLGDGNFTSGGTRTRDTTYTLPGTAVNKTTYTLYVRERDSSGNWSEPAGLGIVYDATKPSVSIVSPRESGTHYFTEAAITLSGTASGPNPIVKVAYRLGSGNPVTAGFTSGNWTIPDLSVAEGPAVTLTVAAEDALGNSSEAQLVLHRDNTPPTPPTLVNQPPASTREPKGTWTWIAGADAPPGSGMGTKHRYNLNNGPWVETSSLAAADLALASGANLFSVQGQDKAGNWSTSAQASVKLDSTKPFLSITSPATNPASLSSLKVTLSGSVSDAGSAVASVSVSGQTAGSPSATITGATWRSAELTLKSGSNTLQVTATDGLGNATVVSLTADVSLSVPTVTITYPPNDFATNKDTVTLRYRVGNGPEIKAPAPENLPVGPSTLTAYSEPNEGGQKGSASVTVIRDITPPKAPTLTAATAITNLDPVWNWTSNGDVSGGAGLPPTPVFRYRFEDGAPVELSVRTVQIPGAPEKNCSLMVAEQDRAGNWSDYTAASAIMVDRTGPVVTILSPADGFITNKPEVTVTYTEKDGSAPAVTKTKVVTLTNPVGGPTHTYINSVPDAAGNTGSKLITFYRRANVLFVRPTAAGAADGSSWSNALGSLNTAIGQAVAGTHIWVSGGNYFAPPADSGFSIKGDMSIFGGFNASGNANKVEDRTFGPSDTSVVAGSNSLSNHLFTVRGKTTYLGGITLDGFKLISASGLGAVDLSQVSGITLRNLQFVAGGNGSSGTALKTYLGSSILGENLKFTNFRTEYYVITVSGSMDFRNMEFSGNSLPSEGGGRFIYGGRDMSFTNCRFLDAIPATFRHIQHAHPEGKLTVTNTTFRLANTAARMAGAVQVSSPDTVYSGNTFVP